MSPRSQWSRYTYGRTARAGEGLDMRKLVVYMLLSLDGVAESPDRFIVDFDDVMHANLCTVIETQDAVLLGRHTYDEWAGYWPTADYQPFADFINQTPKYVATSTPPSVEWSNTTLVDGSVADFVGALKEQPGKDIGVHGSVKLARSLFTAGLVDELRLVIAPAVAGDGCRLFDGVDRSSDLELVHSVGTPSGAVLADYRVVSG